MYEVATVKAGFKLQAVEQQTTDLLTTVNHILNEVREACRLHQLKNLSLDTGEREWMDRIITETDTAAHAVADVLESSRVDRETLQGKVRIRTRLLWVLRDSHKAADKYARLMVCHQSLVSAITILHNRPGPRSPLSSGGLLLQQELEGSPSWSAELENNMDRRVELEGNRGMGVGPSMSRDLKEMLARRSKLDSDGEVKTGPISTTADTAELPGSDIM
ncbi:uncharacterized protein GIQ15_05549 [Arthroderma uncinatum]|uniref:uncharacterized protein n=1 Tax=Arthroderma uncinatum TaxID=74035 RepID=UPI00144ADE8E|nr:uncharacterized protein GIQ15_05549 [Arthroderma uncinatum]KAF3480202.1 hypothetical protein GIQ15_05549 [Arthroderma uncinatum]